MSDLETQEHMDRALDALLAARIAIGGLPCDLPDVALDAALQEDDEYQDARKDFATALGSLMEAVSPFKRDAVLDLESAVNGLVSQGVAVGWKLGLLAAGGHQGASGGELTGEA